MFYWYFPHISNDNNIQTKDKNLIIWLVGGPGCSSEYAIFKENGPFRFKDNK
jgi:serine carboxypeptidase-like clade 4